MTLAKLQVRDTLLIDWNQDSPSDPFNMRFFNQVYVLDASGLMQVTHNKGYDYYSGYWSSDGTQLAITRQYNYSGTLYITSVENPKLEEMSTGMRQYASPIWSPDDEVLAYIAYHSDPNQTTDAYDLILHHLQDNSLTHIEDIFYSYQWRNDQELACIVRDDEQMFWRIYDKMGALVAEDKLDFLMDATRIDVSPNAKYVAYTTDDDETTTVFVAPMDGGSHTEIGGMDFDGDIVWSPDSTMIAYVTVDEDYHRFLSVASVDGTLNKRLLALDVGEYMDEVMPSRPAWAPDSKRVAIGSMTEVDETDIGHAIHVAYIHDDRVDQITEPKGIVYRMMWKPKR